MGVIRKSLAGRFVKASAKPEKNLKTESVCIGVANFPAEIKNKAKNLSLMQKYIVKAHEEGVHILVFPEMALTGYCSSDDTNDAVENAESTNGTSALIISELAHKFNMWIIYGGTEIVKGDSKHAYNSAFICSPENIVTSYRKIHIFEGNWCIPGNEPMMIDTKWGLFGIGINQDTLRFPELARIYRANGCKVYLNLSAVNDFKNFKRFYSTCLENLVSRDGIICASAGMSGKGGSANHYKFSGGSCIISPIEKYIEYKAGGTDNTKPGLYTAALDLASIAPEGLITATYFKPRLYSRLYQKLAEIGPQQTNIHKDKITQGPKVANVQFATVWGNKAANLDRMIKYIEQAASENADIIVFPEMVLSGYAYCEPAADESTMQCKEAELMPGKSSNILSEYALKHNMYIVYGFPEIKDGKLHNSAAILFPDGKQVSFQKIHGVLDELKWAADGEKPYMMETKWGKIGVSICMDGHNIPELIRYYAANGCTILIHLTATNYGGQYKPSKLPWYRQNRMGIYTSRDGMAVISSNLVGKEIEGHPFAEFGGSSITITKTIKKGIPLWASSVNLNGTNRKPNSTKPHMYITVLDLSGLGFDSSQFKPEFYADEYKKLEKLKQQKLSGKESD